MVVKIETFTVSVELSVFRFIKKKTLPHELMMPKKRERRG